jgi:hypothetical protein
MPALSAVKHQLVGGSVASGDAHERELGILEIARAFDAVGLETSETSAVGEEVGFRQGLPTYDQHVPL